MYKVVCIDVDDTLNNYPGWQDEGFTKINGEPLPGAKEGIKVLRDAGVLVLVHSVRCGRAGTKGHAAVVNYLNDHGIEVDGVPWNKPLASAYLDDRAINFSGDWQQAVQDIIQFETWKQRAARLKT